MRSKLMVFVLPDGSITGRYSDLLAVGLADRTKKVRRFTKIEWDDKEQVWRALTLKGKVLIETTTRAACLTAEARLVDLLLRQFYMCYEPARLCCPDCRNTLNLDIHRFCPLCGFDFPIVLGGLKWSDFDLEHLIP